MDPLKFIVIELDHIYRASDNMAARSRLSASNIALVSSSNSDFHRYARFVIILLYFRTHSIRSK